MRVFDAIVVGGGPAGSAAAYVLACEGMRVALLEKEELPREKLCGGLLTQRTESIYKRIFGPADWEQAFQSTPTGISFYHTDRLLNQVDHCKPMYFTSRALFDSQLVELARSRGATILEKARVTSVDVDSGQVELHARAPLSADFIVAADGATSRVGRILGMSLSRNNLAAGIEIEYPRQGVLRDVQRAQIYFGVVRWGYGWVFPKQEHLTIGIAGLVNRNQSLRQSFGKFLRRISADTPKVKWKGHPIPFGNFNPFPGSNSILLAGDAAGLAEPITGEGIPFALHSGEIAAKAILEAARLKTPHDALRYYQPAYGSITRHLRLARGVRYLIFPQPAERLLVKVLSRSQSVIRRYLELLAAEMTYTEYMRFFLRRLVKRTMSL